MVVVPDKLRNPELRFFLEGEGSDPDRAKKPIEKRWNKVDGNNYRFDDPELISHKRNYGVVCGIGNLVVIDFDDREYYLKIKPRLPETFVVLTANSRLPHYYYYMENAILLKKIAIREPVSFKDKKEGKSVGRTLCDIQLRRTGVTCPGSKYGRKYYEIKDDNQIATITTQQLKQIFGLEDNQIKHKKDDEDFGDVGLVDNVKQNISLAVLFLTGVKISTETNMECPFHVSKSGKNLTILPNGKIYCFSCLESWWPDQYLAKQFKIKIDDAKVVIRQLNILYEWRKK